MIQNIILNSKIFGEENKSTINFTFLYYHLTKLSIPQIYIYSCKLATCIVLKQYCTINNVYVAIYFAQNIKLHVRAACAAES